MMHNHNVAIALTDENKKPYREYGFKKLHDKCKTSEVILPFDSHYQILVKNENSERLKLDIDIDGTLITGSGGLIISANTSSYIERFIDTAKKLYFTKKTNEQVADPTNKENGFLTVKVVKEKAGYFVVQPVDWEQRFRDLERRKQDKDPYDYYWRGWGGYICETPPTHWYGTQPWCSTSGGTSIGGSSSGDKVYSMGCRSVNLNAKLSSDQSAHASVNNLFFSSDQQSLDTGATVEGENSSQSFTTTTWNGDLEGSDFILQFKMLGKEVKLSPQEEKDLMEYKRLKAKFEGK